MVTLGMCDLLNLLVQSWLPDESWKTNFTWKQINLSRPRLFHELLIFGTVLRGHAQMTMRVNLSEVPMV